jgi:hypothetical protein
MRGLALLLFAAVPCLAQYTSYGRTAIPKTAVVVLTGTLSSNASSTGIVATPSRKQLGNWGISCSGGTIQPSSIGRVWDWGASALAGPALQAVPVGQLYATAAIKTSAEAAGCAVQSVVAATSSGTGIAAPDNGQNAGGTDSATAITDTYGGTGDDAICSGDPHKNDPTMIVGLPAPGCTSSSSGVISETTAPSFGNSDVLFPTLYASNSTTLDQACCYLRSMYFEVISISTLHNFEMDLNINSSPTAYSASNGGYSGWGNHYSTTSQMLEWCPQDCSGWKKLKGKDTAGIVADLTAYPLTNSHWYHLMLYGHRDPGCTYSSGSACYWYDMMTIYDVTAGTTPVTYRLVDATSGNPAGGIPVNHSTWTAGVTPQVQVDMTTANATSAVHVASDTVEVYYLH